MKKILCVIDSLGSGGAQRQMVNLACGLKKKGHDVNVFVYFPEFAFYKRRLAAAGISLIEVPKGRGFSFKVLVNLIRIMRSGTYDSVISFLDVPNTYVEIASLFTLTPPTLIVSERSSVARESKAFAGVRRGFHICANIVVANSISHAVWLKKRWWLSSKVRVVYNGYSISKKNERLKIPDRPARHKKLLVIGRVNQGKNGLRLIQALILFWQRNGFVPSVLWVGRQEQDPKSLVLRSEMEHLLEKNPEVGKNWEWLGERENVETLLADCDALLHVSLFEGLPNVVCESFIAGRPVILSRVCDHPLLVGENDRGILCDPWSVGSICSAVEQFLALPSSRHQEMAENARCYAENHLTIERMVGDFEALLKKRIA